MRRLPLSDWPIPPYSVGDCRAGIVKAHAGADRVHRSPVHQPAACHAVQLDTERAGLPLDLGCFRHGGGYHRPDCRMRVVLVFRRTPI